MKFGHEYSTALANEGFPPEWVEKAIEYKHLKKCIKKIHNELEDLGLDKQTLTVLGDLIAQPREEDQDAKAGKDEFYCAVKPVLDAIPEEFTPQLRILVDRKTGTPLDARLAPETRKSLRKLARHEIVVAGRKDRLGGGNLVYATHSVAPPEHKDVEENEDSRWVSVPLASATDFFLLLEPKLQELERLRDAETHNLEEAILDLGDAVENVIQPVRDGYETHRRVSYRDLYFWREMFRLYLEKPIFYSDTENKRGAVAFSEAKRNLEEYDQQLRTTGLLDKMRTPQAKLASKQFLDLNVRILSIMHFQEMNARAMTKILKKFNKRTHLQGQQFIKSLRGSPNLLTLAVRNKPSEAGIFADAIARDLYAEIGSKVLAIVPQLDDWICPVCYGMAWLPVKLGCCRAVFCIRCIIRLQNDGVKKCPMCNSETVVNADGRNLDLKTEQFLKKFFPMEVKKRQKENERAALEREYGEEFTRKACVVM
ncbi:uncharacterized protein RCC_01250 [Ramularia collo-cygni]|uniref:RING-14 protein n=1 Tax=Ramularia collo-cygni TaxID=112498 RepID=A0A2D3UWF0_9PEZI|nr:uncharacterized protein RCC_01250 [Ramularia collo-cygni]CZT15386.1 uncharacterized protein RCC_01250 [Ramularia collo-cygni]